MREASIANSKKAAGGRARACVWRVGVGGRSGREAHCRPGTLITGASLKYLQCKQREKNIARLHDCHKRARKTIFFVCVRGLAGHATRGTNALMLIAPHTVALRAAGRSSHSCPKCVFTQSTASKCPAISSDRAKVPTSLVGPGALCKLLSVQCSGRD